MKKLENI